MCKSFCDKTDRWAPFLARFFISIVFLYAAYSKLSSFSFVTQSLSQLPIFPGLVWALLAIIFELGGAVMLLVGYKTNIASWMLIVFTIMATAIGHIAWATSPIQFQWVEILKNLAIVGGLLLTAKHGSELYSLDKKMVNGMPANSGM